MANLEKLELNNQKVIIEVLKAHNNSLSFLELKKKTKLANMYFIKALENLEQIKKLERVKKEKETWILLINPREI
ncbi:MAG: hypothetical protein ACXAC7_03950 [Candidatus Hodarchaeales archaeon]|jgi:hypothetical protein